MTALDRWLRPWRHHTTFRSVRREQAEYHGWWLVRWLARRDRPPKHRITEHRPCEAALLEVGRL